MTLHSAAAGCIAIQSIIEASSGIRGTYYDLSKELNSPFVGPPPPPPLSISSLNPQTHPLFSFSVFHCASWPIPVLLSTSISSLIAPGPLESHKGLAIITASVLYLPLWSETASFLYILEPQSCPSRTLVYLSLSVSAILHPGYELTLRIF